MSEAAAEAADSAGVAPAATGEGQTTPEAANTEAGISALGGEGQPAKPQEPKKDLFAPRFAALTRKERELLKLQSELKRQEDEYKTRAQALSQFEQAKKLSEAGDDVGALAVLGVKGDRLAKFIETVTHHTLLDKNTSPIVRDLMKEVQELKKDKERAKQDEESQAENNRKREEAARETAFKAGLTSFAGKTKDKYELVLHFGDAAMDRVIDKLAEGFTGEPPTQEDIASALAFVEDDLTNSSRAELDTLLALSKLRPKAETRQEEPKDAAAKNGADDAATNPYLAAAMKLISEAGPQASQRPRTLTNAHEGAPIRDDKPSNDPAELFQRALKLMR